MNEVCLGQSTSTQMEKQAAQMSSAHLGDADHIGAGGVSQVVIFIQHELGRVSVRVNDNGVIESPGSHGARVPVRLGKCP